MKLFLFRWVLSRPRILWIEILSIEYVMCLCFSHNKHTKGQSFRWKTKLKRNEVKVFWFQLNAESKIQSSNFGSKYQAREFALVKVRHFCHTKNSIECIVHEWHSSSTSDRNIQFRLFNSYYPFFWLQLSGQKSPKTLLLSQ